MALIVTIIAIIICVVFFIKVEKEKVLLSIYPLKYIEEVETYSQEFGVDKYLILSFIKTESSFDPKAKSSAGAIGLMQITEETFSWLKLKMCPNEDIVFEDLYTPEVAIRFGTYYIYRCLDKYNDNIQTSAAAYHSGWGTVDKLLTEQQSEYLTEFPYSQMRHYVYKIEKAYGKYQELYENKKGV